MPTFTLFGFRVHVRTGFLVFMGLIVLVNGGSLGVWMAGAIAVFTLVHELGHALAARATGAHAEISLDFLAGYASYRPNRRLARWETAGIAVAGPALQITAGVAVLLAMGHNPLDHSAVVATDSSLAVWWAGPIIGLFNLIPVSPLDGGTIAAQAVDKLVPGRGTRIVSLVSLPITIGALIWLLSDSRRQPIAPFAALLLMFQLQNLASERDRDPTARAKDAEKGRRLAAYAERQAWAADRPGPMAPGQMPSPWYQAAVLARSGDTDGARAVLTRSLRDRDADEGWWWPPDEADAATLTSLVDLLEQPLPRGNVYSEQVLTEVLRRIGRHAEAAHYGADSFTRVPTAMGAVTVARSCAALGDDDMARRWLDSARSVQQQTLGGVTVELAELIQGLPEFARINGRADTGEAR